MTTKLVLREIGRLLVALACVIVFGALILALAGCYTRVDVDCAKRTVSIRNSGILSPPINEAQFVRSTLFACDGKTEPTK